MESFLFYFGHTIVGDNKMKNESYWQKTTDRPEIPFLQENTRVDIAIVGGGMTGIMCAYYLKDSGKKIAVFEQEILGCQTTGHTTAKITYLHKTIYQYLISYYGKEIAAMYLESNMLAMKDIEWIIEKEKIDCDYKRNDSFVYTTKQENVCIIEKEIAALRTLGIEPLIDQHVLKNVKKSVGVKKQATFHPLKYLYAIVEKCKEAGVVFYEHSQATDFESINLMQRFTCNGCVVDATHVILATRFPPINFPKFYFLKLNQSREHLGYINIDDKITNSYVSIDSPNETFRSVNDGQIYGGYSHDVGKMEDIKSQIEQNSIQHFSKKPEMIWSAQDCKTHRGIPYIGYFSKEDEYMYVACGFNKWGMTLSHVAARLLHDLILHKDNEYIQLYSPSYSNFMASKSSMIKLLKHSYQGMFKNRIAKKIANPKGINGKVVRIHNRLVGISIDQNKQLHFINPVCPHFKCIVSFNALEKTWDCPCHGSRYDLDGALIEGPATTSLKIVDIKKDS